MLGRLEMTVDQCIEKYNDMCMRIFKDEGLKVRLAGRKGKKFWKVGKDNVQTKSAFDHRILEACVLETIRDRCESCGTAEEARKVLLNDGTDSRCKVWVPLLRPAVIN